LSRYCRHENDSESPVKYSVVDFQMLGFYKSDLFNVAEFLGAIFCACGLQRLGVSGKVMVIRGNSVSTLSWTCRGMNWRVVLLTKVIGFDSGSRVRHATKIQKKKATKKNAYPVPDYFMKAGHFIFTVMHVSAAGGHWTSTFVNLCIGGRICGVSSVQNVCQ
jgi:hypothetical protein